MTIAEACDAYLRDLEARNLAKSTRAAYRSLFRFLLRFAEEEDIRSLRELDRLLLRRWRESWTLRPSTQRQRLMMLKKYFSHAVEEGWIEESPAAGLRAPKCDSSPTLPLSVDEMRDLLAAAAGKPKERALVLLMRYSGLAIGDAVAVEKAAIDASGELVLRRAKTGSVVTVALPDFAVDALDSIARPDRRHYFWTGASDRDTAAKYWRNRLHPVAREAGVEDFQPHRLRDTFAVELLLADVSIQDVSTLLGHTSVVTTERYYAPWNRARRKRLSGIVRNAHRRDPILLEFTPKMPAAAGPTAAAGEGLATRRVSRPTRLLQGST